MAPARGRQRPASPLGEVEIALTIAARWRAS